MTDFMLEKKPGVRQIHTLRFIGKVAAEFNRCLKFFIGRQAMLNFERTKACDEQHGFRPNRSLIDAGMLKLTTFESAWIGFHTVGAIQHDMTAHFDRMYPEMLNIYATRYGVDSNLLRLVDMTILQLQRNVETALGVSEGQYSQVPSEPRIGGMVQGKADVPQLSTQQSDAMLKALITLVDCLHLNSPSTFRSIHHHCIAFADDTDNHVSLPFTGISALLEALQRLTRSAQVWCRLVQICGGLIALHKCTWQMILWTEV